MRICQILASEGEGGLEKHTIELSQELKKEGMDITVIADHKYMNDFNNLHFIPFDFTKGRNNIIVLFKLYKLLNNEKFDVIHTQANKATSMVTKLKPFLGTKIVATLHNYKKNLSPFLKADGVITVSDRIGEKLDCGYKTTVYNGIKIKNEDSINIYDTFHISRDKFILCSVGRLVEAKGFDMLIQSMQYVKEDISLLIIGDGPMREKLETLSKKLNIDNKIIFLGNVENVLTKRIIQASDLVVISSRREGFSYVFAESLLLETPIVSTDVADIEKFITREFTVPFDAQQLAQKINDVKENYQDTLSKYQTVFTKAKNTFTIENMAQQTIQVYKNIIKDSKI